jgi:hypothetical protein
MTMTFTGSDGAEVQIDPRKVTGVLPVAWDATTVQLHRDGEPGILVKGALVDVARKLVMEAGSELVHVPPADLARWRAFVAAENAARRKAEAEQESAA